MGRISLSLRLALLFALLSTLILLALGAFIGRAVESHFEEGDRTELLGKLELVRHVLGESRGITPSLQQRLDEALIGTHHLALGLMDGDGQVRYTSPAGLPEWLQTFPITPVELALPPLTEGKGGHHGEAQRGFLAEGLDSEGRHYRIALAVDIGHHRDFMQAFRNTLWLVIAAAIMVTALLAWVAARRGLQPLDRLTRLARGMSSENLHERIPPESLPVELETLAQAFNDMLTRLEASFERLSGFSSDIAHELRTPVTALMTQTQVALSKARDAEAYREILYGNLETYERLSRMISDMLFLAQAENGLMVPHRETVRLENLVEELFEFYGLLAEESQVGLRCQGQAAVDGDALMLRRALGNLISNALRYTPAGQDIQLTLGATEKDVEILVENPGNPIPAEHLERIFERFHRVDGSRQREGGAGLGLAITRSIIEAHGGHIQAEALAQGNRFIICLPKA